MSSNQNPRDLKVSVARNRRVAAASPVERAVYQNLGMEPGLKRPGLVPLARNPETGAIEITAPQFIYDAARAVAAPAVVLSGQPVDVAGEAQNFSRSFTGAGLSSSLAARPLSGAVLGMSGARGSGKPLAVSRADPSLEAAVRAGGKVYRAPTHLDALALIPNAELRAAAMRDASNRGFVNDRGRFLDRYKAADYARSFDLFSPEAPAWAKTAPELIAENLTRQRKSRGGLAVKRRRK